jgi:predicted PhzF superfamily epimerase YddE/YHI9
MPRYVIADVFTDAPLEGNALAVFTDGRDLTSEQMQRIAREMNLSEEIEIRQGEEIGRPSRLYTRAEGSADRIERVEVAGSAVVVARGELDGV